MAQASIAIRGWAAMLLAVLLASSDLAAPAAAQDAVDDADATDLDTLVAPVALFPDPLLAAVMQASVVPLDVVQAARFLDDYAKDPSLTPDANWDPAVRGLLAFPTVLNGMNEHLDWMQAMGDAVTQRLPDVQDSIQQVRAEFYAGGVLKSDDKQTVAVDSEIIRITPADPNQIFVPEYDPKALIEAVEANDNAAPTGEPTESGAAPAVAAASSAQPTAPAAPAPAEQPPSPAPEAAAPAAPRHRRPKRRQHLRPSRQPHRPRRLPSRHRRRSSRLPTPRPSPMRHR